MHCKTLKDFAADMAAGYGFWSGYYPRLIGQDLLRLLTEEELATPVKKVELVKGSFGTGPDFHYTYDWELRGPVEFLAERFKGAWFRVEALTGRAGVRIGYTK